MNTKKKSEYAKAVDYTKAEVFRREMQAMSKRTLAFPNKRGVFIDKETVGAHGALYEYRGSLSHSWCQTTEGLGNKNWIAEWMYKNAGTGRSYYEGIGIDTMLAAGNDVIAQGALPVVYTDEVAADSYEWGADPLRSRDLAESFYQGCKMCGVALPAGESSSLKYLVKSARPVKSAPILSGCIIGIIAPKERKITGRGMRLGDHIIAVKSSGIHMNGISLVISRAMKLPEKFLTKLPNGKTLGDEALIPTISYVNLVEALLKNKVNIHVLLPGTGSGLAKIAFDKRPFSYRIHSWFREIPPLFLFMRELGVTLKDCLTTFNWGAGYYIYVPSEEVKRTILIGKKAGYELLDVGIVEKGERKVIFEPENIILPPPGE
ncbi:MAG: AIR synthase-related protein [bacterium]|nr:AIR synthase-related protein [bacterium]